MARALGIATDEQPLFGGDFLDRVALLPAQAEVAFRVEVALGESKGREEEYERNYQSSNEGTSWRGVIHTVVYPWTTVRLTSRRGCLHINIHTR